MSCIYYLKKKPNYSQPKRENDPNKRKSERRMKKIIIRFISILSGFVCGLKTNNKHLLLGNYFHQNKGFNNI